MADGRSATAGLRTGVVQEVLPRDMYRVRLDSGRMVRASIPTTSRHGFVRLIAGDTVQVRLTTVDPNRATIIKKL